jgi:hypothetical protein
LILEYDGRIKYCNGRYTDIIHKYDNRYVMIQPILCKKLEIMNHTYLREDYTDVKRYYFDFSFDICNKIGLYYDYNWTNIGKFEICYYDVRKTNDTNKWLQIKTYL